MSEDSQGRPRRRRPPYAQPKRKQTPLPDELVQPVANLIMVAGVDRKKIRVALEQAGRDCGTDAQLDRLIDAAKQWLIDTATAHDDIGYEVGVNRLNDLYAKCVAAKDTKMALAVQHELNRLQGRGRPLGQDNAPTEVEDSPNPLNFESRFREQMRQQRRGAG